MYKTITMLLAEKINQDLFEHLGKVGEETVQHQIRVAEKAVELNKILNYFSEEDIYCSAVGHDIGKSKLSKDLLMQKQKPTDDEIEQFRTHVNLGLKIYEELVLKKIIAYNKNRENVIHYHHERFKGGGYPEGLMYGDIPPSALVVCVIDSYDAIKTRDDNNGNKNGLSTEQALEIIEKGSGTQFEPYITRKFIEMERKNSLEIVRYNKN
jgi:HD-GYP domain-containing protein (c-di-GMP phosphodiesterase class II)